MSGNVLMALPKYVSIPNKNGLPISADPIESFIGCGKKRRLDHLTWEEKLQRKKLKNRVAAQTSRDRKKAKMDEMDQTVRQLRDENIKLKEQTERLTADKEDLLKRTIELEQCLKNLQAQRFDIDESVDKFSHKNQSNIKIESKYDSSSLSERWMDCGIINKNGSAESAYPLPKGSQIKPQSMRPSDNICNYMTATQYHQQETLTPPSTPPPAHQSQPFELSKRATINVNRINQHATTMEEMPANMKGNSDQAALWKIIALCLLYRTCSGISKISMPADWKSLPKVYSQMSQQNLKLMLQKAATELPKLKANQSQCLDQWWGPKQKTWNPAKIPMEA